MPDAKFYAVMLSCRNESNVGWLEIDVLQSAPQLNISQFDPAQGCTWRPAPTAWGGNCADSTCHFTYFLPDYFKLAIYLPSTEELFITNGIARVSFDSKYKALLSSDGHAAIEDTTPLLQDSLSTWFFRALLLTLAFELVIAFFFFLAARIRRKALWFVLLVNLISLPIVWFVFPLLIASFPVLLVISELFAIAFEAVALRGLIMYFIKKRAQTNELTLAKALFLSIIMNVISLCAGGFVLTIWFYSG